MRHLCEILLTMLKAFMQDMKVVIKNKNKIKYTTRVRTSFYNDSFLHNPHDLSNLKAVYCKDLHLSLKNKQIVCKKYGQIV